MKNVKKFLVVAFAFLATLTFTGCGKKVEKSNITPEEAFTKNKTASNEVTNYKMDMKLEMGMSYQGQKMDINMSAVTTFDVKNKTAYMETSTNLLEGLGIDATTKSYIKYDDTTATTYTENYGSWEKTVQNINANPNTISAMSNLVKTDNVKEIEADKDNYNYEVTITKDAFQNLVANSGDAADMLGSINNDIKVIISLDKETYRTSKIKMNLLDILKNANVQGVEYTKATYEFKFYDYNKAGEVVIPDEALNANDINDELNEVDDEE